MAYIPNSGGGSGKTVLQRKSCFQSMYDRLFLMSLVRKDASVDDPELSANRALSASEFIDYVAMNTMISKDSSILIKNCFYRNNRLYGENLTVAGFDDTIISFSLKNVDINNLLDDWDNFSSYFTFINGKYINLFNYLKFEENPYLFRIRKANSPDILALLNKTTNKLYTFVDLRLIPFYLVDGKPYVQMGENGPRMANSYRLGKIKIDISDSNSKIVYLSLSNQKAREYMKQIVDDNKTSSGDTEGFKFRRLFHSVKDFEQFNFSYSYQDFDDFEGLSPEQPLMMVRGLIVVDSIIAYSLTAGGQAKTKGIGADFFDNLTLNNRNKIIFLYAPTTYDETNDPLLYYNLTALVTGELSIFNTEKGRTDVMHDAVYATDRSSYFIDDDCSAIADRSVQHILLEDGFSYAESEFVLDYANDRIVTREHLGVPPYSEHFTDKLSGIVTAKVVNYEDYITSKNEKYEEYFDD